MEDLTEQALEQLKDVQGFMKANNYKVVKVLENYCELEGKVSESSLNPYGIVHGGYLFGLADTAAGIAARTTGGKAVTINSSVNYLHSCSKGHVKAICKCIKSGHSISLYEVSIYDEEKTLLMTCNISYFYLEK